MNEKVFASAKSVSVSPDAADVDGLNAYTKQFVACLAAQKAAIANL